MYISDWVNNITEKWRNENVSMATFAFDTTSGYGYKYNYANNKRSQSDFKNYNAEFNIMLANNINWPQFYRTQDERFKKIEKELTSELFKLYDNIYVDFEVQAQAESNGSINGIQLIYETYNCDRDLDLYIAKYNPISEVYNYSIPKSDRVSGGLNKGVLPKKEIFVFDIPEKTLEKLIDYEKTVLENNLSFSSEEDYYLISSKNECSRSHLKTRNFVIRKPAISIKNGQKLPKITVSAKDTNDQTLITVNHEIKVTISKANDVEDIDEMLICASNTSHCQDALLSAEEGSDIKCDNKGSCLVNAKNGIATFNGLILNGKAERIYNLEFTHKDVSSLEFDEDNETLLEPYSETNHNSQVYIHSAGEVSLSHSEINLMEVEDLKSEIDKKQLTVNIQLKDADGNELRTSIDEEFNLVSELENINSYNNNGDGTITAKVIVDSSDNLESLPFQLNGSLITGDVSQARNLIITVDKKSDHNQINIGNFINKKVAEWQSETVLSSGNEAAEIYSIKFNADFGYTNEALMTKAETNRLNLLNTDKITFNNLKEESNDIKEGSLVHIGDELLTEIVNARDNIFVAVNDNSQVIPGNTVEIEMHYRKTFCDTNASVTLAYYDDKEDNILKYKSPYRDDVIFEHSGAFSRFDKPISILKRIRKLQLDQATKEEGNLFYTNCQNLGWEKEYLSIHKPSMSIKNGKALPKITVNTQADGGSDEVQVKISSATDNQLICLKETKHCHEAKLSAKNNSGIVCDDNGLCSVNAQNGIATFNGLVLNGQAQKIYNLEFTYNGVSSLEFEDKDKKILKENSNINYKSQVYIESAGEVNISKSAVIVESEEIRIQDDYQDNKDEKTSTTIEVQLKDINGNPITDADIRLKTSLGKFDKYGDLYDDYVYPESLFDGRYKAQLKGEKKTGEADIMIWYTDEDGYDHTIHESKITINPGLADSSKLRNHECKESYSYDNKSCLILINDNDSNTNLELEIRDQYNNLTNNEKIWIRPNSEDNATAILTNSQGILKYNWDITDEAQPEILLSNDSHKKLLTIKAIKKKKPKWTELTECFGITDNKLTLEVGNMEGDETKVTVNFEVTLGKLSKKQVIVNANKNIEVECVLGQTKTNDENTNKIIWQIKEDEYHKEWPSNPQITATVKYQEEEFKLETFSRNTKVHYLDWPFDRYAAIDLSHIKKDISILWDPHNGDAKVYNNSKLLTYEPYHYVAKNDLYFEDVPFIDTLSLKIETSDEKPSSEARLSIVIRPDLYIQYQDYFYDSSIDKNGINIHEAIITGFNKSKVSHGYSGEGVNVAIVGDNISEFADLGIIHKHDLILDNYSQKQFNNTVLAGIIAAKPNNKHIRGIAPNVNLHGITIIETNDNYAQRYSFYDFLKAQELEDLSVKIFNLNFSLSEIPSDIFDPLIETYLNEASSDNCTNECQTTIRDAIFIKGMDLYNDKTSALISNHHSVINVSYLDKSQEPSSTTNQLNLANWISVPMSKNGYYTCSEDSMIGSGCIDNVATNITPNNSMASAIVTGVVALMLEANPELTWRDIKFILANTATEDTDAVENNAGYNFHSKYGFGVINAKKAVEMASSYKKDLGNLEIIKTPYLKSS